MAIDHLGDVLEAKFAGIDKCRGLVSGKLPVDIGRNQQATRRRLVLQAGGDIDPGAIKIDLVLEDITHVDAHAQGGLRVILERSLDLDRACDTFGHRLEGDNPAIAHALQNPAVMALDRRFEVLLPQFLDHRDRRDFIFAHHERIIDHVGGHDDGDMAFHCRASITVDRFVILNRHITQKTGQCGAKLAGGFCRGCTAVLHTCGPACCYGLSAAGSESLTASSQKRVRAVTFSKYSYIVIWPHACPGFHPAGLVFRVGIGACQL